MNNTANVSDPHVLPTLEAITRFVTAGKATWTLRNTESGNRVTYKAECKTDRRTGETDRNFFFVSIMTGSDNETHFTYAGTMRRLDDGRVFFNPDKGNQSTGRPAKFAGTDKRLKGLTWLFGRIATGRELPSNMEVWHEGVCGRCSRKLTVPASISTGLGPVCAGY